MLKNSKILIVDDEPRLCDSIKTLLCTQGYEVRTCNSGNEALNILTKDEFNLVLLDVFMEGMDGFQVIENIINQKIDTPVIIITGNASTESAVKALRMGVADYLKKPFEPEELYFSVKNALTHKILKNKKDSITKKLIEREEKLRQIYDNILDVYYEASLDGVILEISPSIEKNSQYKREELIGKSLYDIYTNPTDRDKLVETIIDKGSVRDYEINLSDKNGAQHLCSMNIELIKDTNGNPIKLIGIYRDITEHKKAVEVLKASEEKYRTMIERSNDMIWTLDKIGNFTFFNAQTEKTTGLRLNDWIGKSFVPLIIDEDLPMIMDVFQKSLKGESLHYQLRFKNQNENILTISVNTAPIWENGEVSGIVSFGRDITDKKMLEIQLQQAQKMEAIGTLAGGIAHDFNNILFPIMGHTEMLLMDTPEDSSTHDRLKKIYAGANRAKELVKQILTFSRQEISELKLIKMQPIIKDALKLIRSTIPTTIEIKQDIQTDCRVIKADPIQIHQIVMNLSANAYHAMEKTGGALKVSLKEIELDELNLINPDMTPGVYACLIVTDTGKGINKEIIHKIFDPFFTTKEKGKGTGMGMAIVHGIVKSLDGAIYVNSEVGKGTEILIYFPVAKDSSEKQKIQANQQIQRGDEHLLLVDDEEEIVTMEKLMLEGLGYQITSRTSCIEALEALRANPDKFDLVITDMAMPNMSGDKLAAELTKIRPDIPVLLCTGFSHTMSEEKAASLGIKGFLLKPIVMNDLSHKIREVLDNNKAAKLN